MRREKRKGSGSQGVDFKKVLYISGSIIAVAIIGFVVTFFVYGNTLGNETNLGKLNTNIVDNYSDSIGNVEQTSSSMGKTVNEMSNSQNSNTISDKTSNGGNNNTNTTKYAVNTSEVEKKQTSGNSNTSSNSKKNVNENTTNESTTETNKKDDKTQTDTKEKAGEAQAKQPSFKLPVKGEIIKEFAKDKLVYSNTLGEWVTHNGIDIKAEKTTVIKSAKAGTVKSIKNDPRYGLTVVIEHDGGFTTIYSNLLTAEFVVTGEKVEQGQTIGTVGSTATFEISDEAHLHFEITKDGAAVDPELYINE